MPAAYFTIGHSTRTVAEFAELLREQGVRMVADVRSIPRSRTNPQFNLEALPDALAAFQIGHAHLAALGGRRGRQAAVPDSPNAFWTVKSFRNYADYALTPPFRDGLAELRRMGAGRPTAIMCAEAVWWRCHRRIIADYLLVAGEGVRHILGPGKAEPARLNPGARPQADGTILYPAAPRVP